jgi:quercetin dioxygenase-like cupin family protein
VISLAETEGFKREGFSGHVYVDGSAEMGFTALAVDVHGRHPRKRMVDTTRNYLVLEGTGRFTLGDTTTEVEQGQLFVIPAGSEYEYAGEMKLFEFNVSPDNSFKDEKLESS